VVTELIEAPTLDDAIGRNGPMDPQHAALLGIRLLDVLDAATGQDMVHRFLQPSKVFLGPNGAVRLTDFGIASLIGDPTVARSGAVGGVSFMSPEQAGTPEADIWSLGAVLYFAVEGVPPFSGGDSAAILEAVASEPPRPATAAGPLARVLELSLQKDPSERPSADELRTLLEVAAGPLAPQPEPDVDPSLDPGDDSIHWAEDAAGADSSVGLDLTSTNGSVANGSGPGGSGANGAGGSAPAAVGIAPVDASGEALAERPPPPPLPPRVALERMFSPDPGSPPAVFTLEEEHREPAAPWPVPRRRSPWTVAICTLVGAVMVAILFTNGREIFTQHGQSARIIASVKWNEYVDPATGSTTRRTGGSAGTASTPTSATRTPPPRCGSWCRTPTRARPRRPGSTSNGASGPSRRATAGSSWSRCSSAATARPNGSSPTPAPTCSSTTSTWAWSRA
jgi:hypothetical protein